MRLVHGETATGFNAIYQDLGIKPYSSWHTYFIAFVSGVGTLAFGYASNVLSGTLAQPTFAEKFLLTSSNEEGLIGGLIGAYFGGGALGACVQTPISNRFGRRTASATAAVLMTISAVLCCGAPRISMFIVGRIIGGIAAGIITTNIPVYVSEIAPAHSRGLIAGLTVTCVNAGYLLSAALALAFTFVKGTMQWRANFIVLTGLSILSLISLLLIPESPRWLVEHEQYEKAWKILAKIHSHPKDTESKIAHAEMIQIRAQVDAERTLPKGWIYILKTRHLRKRAFVGFWMWFLYNSSGVLVIANLAPLLFGALGYSTTLQLGLTTAWFTLSFCGGLINAMITDHFGRRKLILSGGVVISAVLSIECALQKFYLNSSNLSGIKAAVAFYFIYIFCSLLFFETVAYNYVAEIWPTHLRSHGISFSGVSYFVMTIAYAVPASTAFKNIGWRYYLVFIVLTIFSTLVAFFTFPETKGLTLEEVGAMFGDKVEMTFEEIRNTESQKLQDIPAEVQHAEAT